MGALMIDSGPAVGEPAPRFDLPALGGATWRRRGGRRSQLCLLSPTCRVQEAAADPQSIAAAEAAGLDIVFQRRRGGGARGLPSPCRAD